MMMHGYYTNKFIIISYLRSRLYSAKCKSIITCPANYSIKHVISSVRIKVLYVFSNYIHHILSVPPFRPLAIHSTSRIKLPRRIMS